MPTPTQPVIDITDNATKRLSTDFLFGGKSPHDAGREATISHQFREQNKPIFDRFGVDAHVEFTGQDVRIKLASSDVIGAFPLRSPTTGEYDYGMVIRPRFEWSGLGPMLGTMGWKIIPELQNLPVLPSSARHIPRWVMSSVVLSRIDDLLECIERRFELREDDLKAPRGRVDWTRYATEKVSRMQFMEVPCRFSDLRDDHRLLAAIHFVLRQQMSDLQSQRSAGVVVRSLINTCEKLMQQVRNYPAREPTPRMLEKWFSGRLSNPKYEDGIQALQWSVENRGLAGLSSLQGIPWKMSMPEFFEYWVETLAEQLCQRTGGTLRSSRRNNTVTPIAWDTTSDGSQKSLRPDIVIDRPDETIIVDAKYKSHWHEITTHRWRAMSDDARSSHRHDLHQVLAYSTLFTTPTITACLLYPCWPKTWERLHETNQIHSHASVYSGTREVNIVLTAVPMNARVKEVTDALTTALQ